jgi:hypothetical protein
MLDGFLPQTVSVNPKAEGLFDSKLQFSPNPVIAELDAAPPRVGKRKPHAAGSIRLPRITPASHAMSAPDPHQ